MNAEIPLAPLSRVGHRHDGVPGRLAAVGDPALGPVEDPVVTVGARPGAHRRGVGSGLPLGQCVRRHRLAGRNDGSTWGLSSSEPRRIRPIVPSLFTGGDQRRRRHTRATSSMTMQAATASAPWPPYSSGIWMALKPDAFSAFSASSGSAPARRHRPRTARSPSRTDHAALRAARRARTRQTRRQVEGPDCRSRHVGSAFLSPARLSGCRLTGQVERDVDDHVLLAADQPAPADLEQDRAGVDAVALDAASRRGAGSWSRRRRSRG